MAFQLNVTTGRYFVPNLATTRYRVVLWSARNSGLDLGEFDLPGLRAELEAARAEDGSLAITRPNWGEGCLWAYGGYERGAWAPKGWGPSGLHAEARTLANSLGWEVQD